MAAAWDPGIVGGLTNSHISVYNWQNLYRKTEKCLCSGAELLFLPRGKRGLPYWSLQAVIGSWNFKMAYYVAGFLIFVGALLGRLVCGFLCPWADPGSVEQDSFSKEDPDISGR